MAAGLGAFYVDLGRRIRVLRSREHLTQQQLASRLNPPVTRASIANIESGKQRVLAHTLVQISGALNASVQELVAVSPPLESSVLHEELHQKLALPDERIHRLVRKLTPPRARGEARRHGRVRGSDRG